MRLFKQLRTISVEVIYLTVAVAIGFAVIGYMTKTGAWSQLEGVPGVGTIVRGARALVYQTYNP